MMKTKTYRAKSLNQVEAIFVSKITETKCVIKKQYLQHWALENMKAEFLACTKNQWDPHPVNNVNSSHGIGTYAMLAESEKGPQIIEHKNNIAT